MANSLRVIELQEYQTVRFQKSEIREEDGAGLWDRFSKKVSVEFPTHGTNHEWRLTSLGWVGYIPFSDELAFALHPKVPLGNLFRMLEYAYSLKSFELHEGLHHAETIPEFYERLANILARRVLDRARRGFYRTYVPDADALPYLRGSLDLSQRLRQPWRTRLPCDFHEHTADVDENRILLWTLRSIARTGLCTERVLPTVRRSVRTLQGTVSYHPFSHRDCIGRLYNRLNQDYQPLHALCRFFLEHSGPTAERGSREMIPFLVNVASLFELFVAEWLKLHLPRTYHLASQETVLIGSNSGIRFQIDLVISDATTGEALAVFDTKYKAPKSPSESDVQQAVAYAESKQCRQAFLIYPTELAQPIDVMIGRVRVRSVVFDVGGDVDAAGRGFLESSIVGCGALIEG